MALSCCLRDYHSCLGVQLDSELDDMLLRGKLPQRFQHGANRRPRGLNRLVEARLGLKHPNLVAHDVLRADVDLGDLNEHWTMPCFELNNLGHTNRPYDWLDGDQREKRLGTGVRTTGRDLDPSVVMKPLADGQPPARAEDRADTTFQ